MQTIRYKADKLRVEGHIAKVWLHRFCDDTRYEDVVKHLFSN